MVSKTRRAVILLCALLGCGLGLDVRAMERGDRFAQAAPRTFDSRPLAGPPTPAPRSFSGDTMVLPRVPYDNRIDGRGIGRDRWPGRLQQRGPESQRVVPRPPAAGGDPARFFDKPADNTISCEQLRKLAQRTGRLYWANRYTRCMGTD